VDTLRRIARLLSRPRGEWERIAAEETTFDALLRRPILPLAAPAAVSTWIGMHVFDRAWDPLHGYLVPADQIFAASATTYFASVGSILALAGIFALVTPMFGRPRDFVGALKVAAWGAVPVLLAGGMLFLPVMAIVAVVGLGHTLYLLALGADRVLHIPRHARAEFVGISIVLLALASAVAGAVASSVGLL
jgi:hypothetical protein